jgi:hypothetical protein
VDDLLADGLALEPTRNLTFFSNALESWVSANGFGSIMMATMAAPAINVHDAVLQALRENEYQPMELLVHLGQLGYTDSDIKQAVSELIHEGKIELTSHRLIKIASEFAA